MCSLQSYSHHCDYRESAGTRGERRKYAFTDQIDQRIREIYLSHPNAKTRPGIQQLAEQVGIPHLPPRVFRYPQEAEVIGQVVGVAMRLGEWHSVRESFPTRTYSFTDKNTPT